MNINVLCPACGRGDQFVQSSDINPEAPDATPVSCLCGAVTPLGTLRRNPDPVALREEAERLAIEATRHAFRDLLK